MAECRAAWSRAARRSLFLPLLCAVMASGCAEDIPQRNLGPDWMHKGKLAGLGVHVEMSDRALDDALNQMVNEHVDIVIADSDLSNYKTDAQFKREMGLLKRVAEKVHERGMKVIWYMTTRHTHVGIAPPGQKGRQQFKIKLAHGYATFYPEPAEVLRWAGKHPVQIGIAGGLLLIGSLSVAAIAIALAWRYTRK